MNKTTKKKASKKPQRSNRTRQKSSSPTRQRKTSLEDSGTALPRPEQSELDAGTPVTFMRRFSEEMDQLFENLGSSRGLLAPAFASGLDKLTTLAAPRWSPQVEVFEGHDQLIIEVDLPGLAKENVDIDVTNDTVVISGERKSERKENVPGYSQSQRYGSFYRRIPLPEGVSAEKATTDFRDGVLEIKIPITQPAKEKRRQLENRGETGNEDQPQSRKKATGQR